MIRSLRAAAHSRVMHFVNRILYAAEQKQNGFARTVRGIMPYSPMAVANEFIRLAGPGVLTQMQLQKLAFIANGWNLAVNGKPLIADFAQAWDYGPVFPALYDHLKFYGTERISREITTTDGNAFRFFGGGRQGGEPIKASLTPQEKDVIDRVWKRYGEYSGPYLSNLTHKAGTPWYNTYFGTAGKNGIILNDDIRRHYVELARAGAA